MGSYQLKSAMELALWLGVIDFVQVKWRNAKTVRAISTRLQLTANAGGFNRSMQHMR